MKLNLTNKFRKEAAKLILRNPKLRTKLHETLKILTDNPFDPALKTHKLKGSVEDIWSLSLTYEIRIIIQFRNVKSEKFIDLLTIGTHDQVY